MPQETVRKIDFIALQELHKSHVKASDSLEEQNRKLIDRNIILENQLVNMQRALDINREIMANAVTKQNEERESMATEVRELKTGKTRKHRRI